MSDVGSQHRWMMVGSARLTDDQAATWVSVEGSVEEGLELRGVEAVCVVCGVHVSDEACPGPDPATSGHVWSALMTMSLTQVELAVLNSVGTLPEESIPRSVGLTCVLCGQEFEGSEARCPEREFWAESS